jgi:hypothetical protein
VVSQKQADALGPNGRMVMAKVRMLRRKRGLSIRALAAETTKLRRTLGTDALNKIELGVRRVDVDDLFALASTLGVTPAQLLEPPETCTVCDGQPPAGFACLACGADGGEGAAGATPVADITPAVRPGRRNRITDEHLRAVADVYRSAEAHGLPPTRTVADRFTVPHSTAAKWVGHARKRLILGPAVNGKAGDQP